MADSHNCMFKWSYLEYTNRDYDLGISLLDEVHQGVSWPISSLLLFYITFSSNLLVGGKDIFIIHFYMATQDSKCLKIFLTIVLLKFFMSKLG